MFWWCSFCSSVGVYVGSLMLAIRILVNWFALLFSPFLLMVMMYLWMIGEILHLSEEPDMEFWDLACGREWFYENL